MSQFLYRGSRGLLSIYPKTPPSISPTSLRIRTMAAAPYFAAVKTRRTVYALTDKLPESVTDARVTEIVQQAILDAPTSFNNQSNRAIILFGASHAKLWSIVLEALRGVTPPEHFAATEGKVKSFAAGHGTVLHFVDREDVQRLENQFPLYAPNFAPWALQSVGMSQHIVWTALAVEGVGASLQHYGELIKDRVREEFNVKATWDLISQQPFGEPAAQWVNPQKEFKPLEETVKVFN